MSNLEEELQLLAGDNTGENLHGLLSQAACIQRRVASFSRKGLERRSM